MFIDTIEKKKNWSMTVMSLVCSDEKCLLTTVKSWNVFQKGSDMARCTRTISLAAMWQMHGWGWEQRGWCSDTSGRWWTPRAGSGGMENVPPKKEKPNCVGMPSNSLCGLDLLLPPYTNYAFLRRWAVIRMFEGFLFIYLISPKYLQKKFVSLQPVKSFDDMQTLAPNVPSLRPLSL